MNPMQPNQNSIIDEIHGTRERLAELYHNDMLSYSQAAQEHCLALGFSLVNGPRLRHFTKINKTAINT